MTKESAEFAWALLHRVGGCLRREHSEAIPSETANDVHLA
jgi:hypothetical protein